MNRRDWWVGVAILTCALVLHAIVPRYQYQHTALNYWLKVDRWTGHARTVIVYTSGEQVPRGQ